MNCRLTIFALTLCWLPQANSASDDLGPELLAQWQQFYDAKVEEFISSYAAEMLSVLAPKLAATKREQAAKELHNMLYKSVAWESVRGDVTRAIVAECGEEVVKAMEPYVKKPQSTAAPPSDLNTRYVVCMLDAFDHISANAMFGIIAADGGRSEKLIREYAAGTR